MTAAPSPEALRILLLIRDRKTEDLCLDDLTARGVVCSRAEDLQGRSR